MNSTNPIDRRRDRQADNRAALRQWTERLGRYGPDYDRDGWTVYTVGIGARQWRAMDGAGRLLAGRRGGTRTFATAGAAARAVESELERRNS